MFKKLNTDPNKRPRLLGERDLSHAKVSSREFRHLKGAKIFGEAEPADYIYQVVEGAVRSHKLFLTGGARSAHFTCLAISSASRMAIPIGSQPKPSSTAPLVLLNANAWSTWPKPILRWLEAS